jgi:hypothetical protein
MSGPYTPRDLEWHDHATAAAAAAWMNEPRDTEAYRRMVEAVLRRRAFLQPRLDEAGVDDPEVLDELGLDQGPQQLGNALDDVMALIRTRSGTVEPESGAVETGTSALGDPPHE